MKVLDSLLAISAYPIPVRTVEACAMKRGVSVTDEIDFTMFDVPAFRLTVADLMMWLYYAPTVSQGGQSYSLTDAQREQYRRRAMGIYDELGDEENKNSGIRYGYKGENL